MTRTSRPGVAISAPHPAAVDAAERIIMAGGNAVDAAVAAAAVLTVVYPHMCSIGGDAIALLRGADGKYLCVNGSGGYGSDETWQERLSGLTVMPLSGPLTVSVPGVASVWDVLLDLGGSLPVDAILEPAIDLARRGFAVSPNLAMALDSQQVELRADPGLSEVFFEADAPRRVGDVVIQATLAASLSRLAREGLDSIYRGGLAKTLADGLQTLSVPVTAGDLAGHRVIVEDPLGTAVNGLKLHTAGPNSQGYTALHALGSILQGGPTGQPVHSGVLAEIFYAADAHRDAHLADPRYVAVEVEGLFSDAAYRDSYRQAADRMAGVPRPAATALPRPGGDTVGITAVDGDGMAVSLIQSVFHSFGALILEPNTGFVLHNRAAFFSLDPYSPNRVEARKRPAHTLTPVIYEDSRGLVAAHGTMGGRGQSQIHSQLVLRALQGMSAQEAVAAPRFIVGGIDSGTNCDHVLVEPNLEDASVRQIRETSLRVFEGKYLDDQAGHAMIARRDASGSLDAGADPRSDGSTHISIQ